MTIKISDEETAKQRGFAEKVREINQKLEAPPTAHVHTFGCQQNVSDGEKIKASLQRFKTMEGEYRIFPGHGKSTTLALEQEYNPYLKDKK